MSLDISLYITTKAAFSYGDSEQVFDANITHNLGQMADEAGIYECLWRAPENGFTCALHLIEPLTKGIALMESDPERFERFNAPNGWGKYKQFLPWLKNLLQACIEYPESQIQTSR